MLCSSGAYIRKYRVFEAPLQPSIGPTVHVHIVYNTVLVLGVVTSNKIIFPSCMGSYLCHGVVVVYRDWVLSQE